VQLNLVNVLVDSKQIPVYTLNNDEANSGNRNSPVGLDGQKEIPSTLK